MKREIFVITALFLFTSCVLNSKLKTTATANETVLKPGMNLCATNKNKIICIYAENDFKRTIYWNGLSNSITLIPRQKRWHGKLGLVSPDPPKNFWIKKERTTRVLIEEAQVKVRNIDEFTKRLNFPTGEDGYNVVYNNDGLLIIWKSSVLPENSVLDLMVFQIIINGKKPTSIPGSQNDKIVLEKGD